MSLRIEGHQPRSVSHFGAARTVISPAFAGTLRLSRPLPGPFLVTVSIEISGPLSFVLECSVVAQGLAYDIVLGVDWRLWSAFFRDSLISSGAKVPDTFDAWAFGSPHLIKSELYRFTAAVLSRPWQ
ncbi:hypothetical protein B0H13DRAFT_2346942 [Mycena leptocephala]|jgi:hypothetical protein|nr:hypothetical protein B0H13DRAFT_2346942 [Mycena leptocephala]